MEVTRCMIQNAQDPPITHGASMDRSNGRKSEKIYCFASLYTHLIYLPDYVQYL